MEIGVTDSYKHMHMETDSSRQPEGGGTLKQAKKEVSMIQKMCIIFYRGGFL
jgi:hypothetical protein